MLYRRGKIWWFKFNFAGRCFQESAKTKSKTVARAAEHQRRRDLEDGYHGLKKREAPRTLSVASREWLELKTPSLAPKSVKIEQTNLGHLLPVLGSLLISDVGAMDIAKYQDRRLKEKASPKTINLEVGTLRAILRRHRLWAQIQPDVKMLPVHDDVGRAISADEERRLLDVCSNSRSRSLLPAVTLALSTGMRYSEIRLLRWDQIDLVARRITVGRSKTESGTGRSIPLNDRATETMKFWAANFPDRHATHFVFPAERYGVAGHKREVVAYDTDPTKAINSWKEAWESAKETAKVQCRFHDLRHTGCTRMLEGGVPLPVVASILGWSAATTVRMAKRYGHIGQVAQRQAVSWLEHVPEPKPEASESTPCEAQTATATVETVN
jgi:integrase